MKPPRLLARMLTMLSLLVSAALPASATATSLVPGQEFNPVLVYVLAGKGTNDGAFIASARAGAARAQHELGVTFEEVKLNSNDNVADKIEALAKQGKRQIIAIGYENVMPVLSIAERYPNTYFTVIDGLVPPLFHNVQSIIFKDHEGAFLVGMVAALTSKTNHIGFIGGVDIPLIRNFAYGYEQGAKYVNPNINLTVDMLGKDPSVWADEKRAESLANEQYSEKVDVIFAAAGGAGLGVLKAANESGKFAIGVDVNQNGLYPGHILTSMIKRVDVAVYQTLKLTRDGEWSAGIKYFGVKDGALDFAVDEHNSKLLTAEIIEKVSAARERLMNGTLDVQPYTPR